jgi:hypothetical protein
MPIARASVYPNPSSGEFFIAFSSDQVQDIDIIILDIQGKVQRKESLGRISAGEFQIRIPGGELEAGPYIVRLENSMGQASKTWMLIMD